MIEKNPGEREKLEALSGDGVTNHELAIQEIEEVVKGNAKAEGLKTQYDTLLTNEEKNEELRLKNQVANAKADLASLNFKIMPSGIEYYLIYDKAKSFENYLGVLISAILISLGAPFWFNNLQRIFAIRDYFDIKKKSGT